MLLLTIVRGLAEHLGFLASICHDQISQARFWDAERSEPHVPFTVSLTYRLFGSYGGDHSLCCIQTDLHSQREGCHVRDEHFGEDECLLSSGRAPHVYNDNNNLIKLEMAPNSPLSHELGNPTKFMIIASSKRAIVPMKLIGTRIAGESVYKEHPTFVPQHHSDGNQTLYCCNSLQLNGCSQCLCSVWTYWY
jgi:hypothetical protein